MDTAELANSLVNDALPLMESAGEKALEGALMKLAGKVGGWAVGAVGRLWGKVAGDPGAKAAADAVAADPKDKSAAGALAFQLRLLLQKDPALAQEIERLLRESRPAGNKVTASGERSVAIGGNASGNTITTGDSRGKR